MILVNWPLNILYWRGWCLLNCIKGSECPQLGDTYHLLQVSFVAHGTNTQGSILPHFNSFFQFLSLFPHTNFHTCYHSFWRHNWRSKCDVYLTNNPCPNTGAAPPTTSPPPDASHDSWNAACTVLRHVTRKRSPAVFHIASQLLEYYFAVQI